MLQRSRLSQAALFSAAAIAILFALATLCSAQELARRLNERLLPYAATMPAIAPVERAVMSDDAPAVGAAILPFTHRLLPTRSALMKVSGG